MKRSKYWTECRDEDYLLSDGNPTLRGTLACALGDLRFRLTVQLCKRWGHRWVDESVAGPESGSIDLRCTRCGETYHHPLY